MTKRGNAGPAHTVIAREIGVAIVTGRYIPGEVLTGEIELSQQRGVSRSVIREALRMLAAKGLVESRPKAGTKVRKRADWNLLDPVLLSWMFEAEPPRDFVRSLFQLRLIVEPAAAEIAASHRTARQLSTMGHSLERMAKFGLGKAEGQLADQEFHETLLAATQNELLVSLSASIAAAVRWTTFFKYRTSRHPRDPILEHRRLFEAVANGDGPAAREVATELILQARDDTEKLLTA